MVSVMKNPLNGRKILNRRLTKVVMLWDFQNVPLGVNDTKDAWFYMDKYLDIAFPGMETWDARVYGSHEHSAPMRQLEPDFDVRLVWSNADDLMTRDIRSFCGLSQTFHWLAIYGQSYGQQELDLSDTALVLVSKDGDFAGVLREARKAKVDVYLWAPQGYSHELLNCINKDNVIPWNHPKLIVSEHNLGRPRRRS